MRFYLTDQLAGERRITYALFLRLMGLVYFCAFISLVFQIEALLGDHGISPAAEYLAAVKGSNGALSYLGCPTLLWLAPSTTGLYALTIAGSIMALCLMAGILPWACCILLYVFYLSITSVGQEFLSYQWDMLLLQAGFLAIIVSLIKPERDRVFSALVTFFLFYLNFRLMFSSGMCKLASGDTTWSNLTALSYHFFTQPLPTPLAIVANAMPLPLSKFVCFLTLAIEIGAPFLIFLPRIARLCGFVLLLFLQLAIMLTGNYGFFNLLSIVVMVPLLDDAFLKQPIWKKLLREKCFESVCRLGGVLKLTQPAVEKTTKSDLSHQRRLPPPRLFVAAPLAALVAFNCLSDFSGRLTYELLPVPLTFIRAFSQTFGISNSYGLFAVMTVERPEIIVEGSDDGVNYKAYQFKYKVSRPDQAPSIVAPMQPRLDWQMWFESLNATYGEPYSPIKGLNPNPSTWFVKFLVKLSENDPAVTNLLAVNPFAAPNKPPKFVRARVVNYTMVSPVEFLETKRWWKTTDIGTYFPGVRDAKNQD